MHNENKRLTEEKLRSQLYTLKARGMSLREIASLYPEVINHMDIRRALDGKMPQSPEKRWALGLLETVPAYPCPYCGVVHTRKCWKQYTRWRDMPNYMIVKAFEERYKL